MNTTTRIGNIGLLLLSFSSSTFSQQSTSKPRLTVIEPQKRTLEVVELRGGVQPANSRGSTVGRTLPNKNLYHQFILESSQKWGVDVSLIYAVIHVESYFNPRAVSPKNALGLMQLTPNGAILEFSNRQMQGKKIPDKDVFSPKFNIEIGTYYLKLLESFYLKDINSQRSRTITTIAAYNCGLSNLMKYTFGTKSIDLFVSEINKTPYNELHKILTEKFPITETRNYVKKVLDKRTVYSKHTH